MRLPVLIHKEGGVKAWNFQLSLNRHIISSPFPFLLCVSPLMQLIPGSALLQQHWFVGLVMNWKEDLIELNIFELGRRKSVAIIS